MASSWLHAHIFVNKIGKQEYESVSTGNLIDKNIMHPPVENAFISGYARLDCCVQFRFVGKPRGSASAASRTPECT